MDNSYRDSSNAALMNLKRALIICDGELKRHLINKLVNLNKPLKQFKIIAADGASNFLYKHKIIPDFIIGDLDSLSDPAKKYFTSKKVIIRKIFNQNRNDFEKCLQFAISKGWKQIAIIGFAGKRFDHTLNNLSVLKKYCGKTDSKVYDDSYEYFIINKSIEFSYKPGEVVSIMALPKAIGVKTTGLKYSLNNETLEFGTREGALNSAISNNVKIQMNKGYLLIAKKHFGLL